MNTSIKLLIGFFLVALIACKTPPDKAIKQRWKATGVLGGKAEQERYKELFAQTTTEYQFKDDGKFDAYQNGVILVTGNYSMAADGKSLTLQAEGQSYSMVIIKLTAETLEAVTKGFMAPKDTIVYMAVH